MVRRASSHPPSVVDRTVPLQEPSSGGGIPVLVSHGSDAFRLVSGTCRIGSSPRADLVIHDRTVSREHVELTLGEAGVHVRDLGSRNGTWYLGQRIEAATIRVGAAIRVGGAVLWLDVDANALAEEPASSLTEYRGLIGWSASMRGLFAKLVRLESSQATVLLEGESGVGKEVVASAIHSGSHRASRPYVVLDCGSLPRELVASELFGHCKGAFTGATSGRKGAFESADGGTLFLDEIGELPMELQPMLLRALETGEVRAVGSDRPRRVDVRVIAATNRDLKGAVIAGAFREDLYYRLAVVRLRVPPLRERLEDIEPLVRHFGKMAGIEEVPTRVIELLKARTFRGNVRELRNAVESYAALGSLPADDGPAAADLDRALTQFLRPELSYAEQKEALVDRFTRLYLAALLAHAGGNQSRAAKIAGLDRGYLGRMLQKHLSNEPTANPLKDGRRP